LSFLHCLVGAPLAFAGGFQVQREGLVLLLKLTEFGGELLFLLPLGLGLALEPFHFGEGNGFALLGAFEHLGAHRFRGGR